MNVFLAQVDKSDLEGLIKFLEQHKGRFEAAQREIADVEQTIQVDPRFGVEFFLSLVDIT